MGSVVWCCSGDPPEFDTTQPDRANCTDTWVTGIGQMIQQNAKVTEIASAIGGNLTIYNNPTGGTILKVTEFFVELLGMEKGFGEDFNIYVENITYSVSQIFGSYLGKKQ